MKRLAVLALAGLLTAQSPPPVKLTAKPAGVTLSQGTATEVKISGSPGPFTVHGCAGGATASFGGNVLTVVGMTPGTCVLVVSDRSGASLKIKVHVVELSGS